MGPVSLEKAIQQYINVCRNCSHSVVEVQ